MVKINNFFALAVFVFVVMIFFSLTSSCSLSYVPHLQHSSLSAYPYEGFSNIENQQPKIQYTTNDCVKMKGFEGLYSSPDKENVDLGTFLNAKGDVSCKSYGLSNSKGFLCLSPEQLQLLSTRGGNFA